MKFQTAFKQLSPNNFLGLNMYIQLNMFFI